MGYDLTGAAYTDVVSDFPNLWVNMFFYFYGWVMRSGGILFTWRMFYYIVMRSSRTRQDFLRSAIGVAIKFDGTPMRLDRVFCGEASFAPLF